MGKGIIKRFNELGRIVVPKIIRQSLKITDTTPILIQVENDMIILKKQKEEKY